MKPKLTIIAKGKSLEQIKHWCQSFLCLLLLAHTAPHHPLLVSQSLHIVTASSLLHPHEFTWVHWCQTYALQPFAGMSSSAAQLRMRKKTCNSTANASAVMQQWMGSRGGGWEQLVAVFGNSRSTMKPTHQINFKFQTNTTIKRWWRRHTNAGMHKLYQHLWQWNTIRWRQSWLH